MTDPLGLDAEVPLRKVNAMQRPSRLPGAPAGNCDMYPQGPCTLHCGGVAHCAGVGAGGGGHCGLAATRSWGASADSAKTLSCGPAGSLAHLRVIVICTHNFFFLTILTIFTWSDSPEKSSEISRENKGFNIIKHVFLPQVAWVYENKYQKINGKINGKIIQKINGKSIKK